MQLGGDALLPGLVVRAIKSLLLQQLLATATALQNARRQDGPVAIAFQDSGNRTGAIYCLSQSHALSLWHQVLAGICWNSACFAL